MPRVFERVLILMFENQYREYVMANAYMRGLARQGIDLTNYHGVMHPSQTNYIASIAGELCNVTDDDSPGRLPQRTIVDLIEEAPGDLQWKAYMDGYRPAKTPWSPELVPEDDFPYVIKHNPFSSFANIVGNEARWQRIVSETEFFKDLLNGELPNYAWFTPDMWNDGHYLDGTKEDPPERAPALVDQLARWLENFFGALRFPGPDSLLPEGTLVVVTFDESDFLKTFDAGKKYTYDGPNQVYSVLLGDMVKPGVEGGAYNHYNLLATIERNFELGHLGKNDAGAAPMRFLWGEELRWGVPEETPVRSFDGMAMAAFGGVLHMVVRGEDGGLAHTSYDGQSWAPPRPIGVAGRGPLSMAALGDELVVVFESEEGQLASLRYTMQEGWVTAFEPIGDGSRCALASFAGDPGSARELMAVWVDPDGCVQSRRRTSEGWMSDMVDTGVRCQGDLCLGAVGPSLYLVYQNPDSDGLLALSYNGAQFNVTTLEVSKYSGPWDNTTCHRWSPTPIPVGRFGAAAFSGTPGELEPVTLPVRAGAPLALANFDGVLHLMHPGTGNRGLITERFSVPGILTPELAISYKATEDKTTNNGYGTLAEAGWTASIALDQSWVGEGGVLGLSAVGAELLLVTQECPGGNLQLRTARYAHCR